MAKGPVKVHQKRRVFFLQLYVFRCVEQEYEIGFWWSASKNRFFHDCLV